MVVFDFDNTIYNGESAVDYAFYMIRHNKRIIRFIPTILLSLAGYKLCLLSKEKLESIINKVFDGVMDGEVSFKDFVEPFWESHSNKLNSTILKRIKPGDVIISAGPVFLLEGITEIIKTDKIVGSELDFDKRRITWFNFGDNKVKRYRQLYGDSIVDAFYTDSYYDKDMMMISRDVYIVKSGRIVKHLRRKKV
ncbi:MAG: haloacid dehalogenase-like hydrolase [Eubacterium sp.]|nr:haloacid dehalogenase-like hydrolase [Eubacterium sp.]